ncbi:efflux RND transporter periplasmic adaptor subunit [Bacillus benzoevorans]|uniref:HlyD family secretion protein n=1 Tax=Bacillus benzoevorans TaxID=1456 RepID=A0A7X0HVF6_9BACI|nr:efflux RND transporter periplasmic adaptor subunit [Bacillus benzoevorans]MBB6447615.1 HlyD family secretion protein [Bacillus benzoevorans]
MKKWIPGIIAIIVVLFVAANLYLIFKDKSAVARSFYINKWIAAKEEKLVETMKKDGVSAPLEEQLVYYDDSKGSFEGFSVKRGEEVQMGTTLFKYETDTYQETIDILEAEKDSLEKQIDGLEDKLDDLEDLESDTSLKNVNKKEGYLYDTVSIEMDIFQTEAEIKRLEGEVKKVDSQIATADDKLPRLEEKSDITGVVKDINKDLSNPVLTIASKENMIKGTLTEGEQAKVEPGMEAVVTANGKKYKGYVDQVMISPENEPKVEKKSFYSFTVVLAEEPEKMAHGTHVDVKITTEAIEHALAVPASSVDKISKKKQQLSVLDKGKIKQQKVTTGLKVGGKQQIETGIKEGTIIARKPLSWEKGTPTFYTPLKVSQWEKDMYKNMRKLEMAKLAGKGFLSM